VLSFLIISLFTVPDLSAFFQDQAEASAHVQFVYDLTARQIVFVNAEYQRVLMGHPARVNEDLPALLARLHPDDRDYLDRYWERWTNGRMPDEVEIRLTTPNQPDQWFCLTPHHQQTATGRTLVGGILRNISVSKHYKQNADGFNARKNLTLEILSHDLSSAFIMVEQIAQYLSEEINPTPQGRIVELLGVLRDTSRDSVKMIRDLINLEFLVSANSDLKRDRVDVGLMLQGALDDLRRQENLLGHRFDYSLPAAPVYANLDINKFVQVLLNLVSNAIKFTPDGGRVAVRIEAEAGQVVLHVSDDGIGIPQAMAPFLFERFTKARRPGLRGEETTGLGLALCKVIVELHEGQITVVSEEGRGSTFTIRIPQSQL